jgi:hypothetical protein
MKIQSINQVIGLPVATLDGHTPARVVGVECAPDNSYDAVWFVVRRGWLRARLRAVPAEQAELSADRTVKVPFTRATIMASPPLHIHGLADANARTLAAEYYATQPK